MNNVGMKIPDVEHTVARFWPFAASVELQATGLRMVEDNLRYLAGSARLEVPPPPDWATKGKISVIREPRPSSQSRTLPSIWFDSPNRESLSRTWNTRFRRRAFGRHRPSRIWIWHHLRRHGHALLIEERLDRERRAKIGLALFPGASDPSHRHSHRAVVRRLARRPDPKP